MCMKTYKNQFHSPMWNIYTENNYKNLSPYFQDVHIFLNRFWEKPYCIRTFPQEAVSVFVLPIYFVI